MQISEKTKTLKEFSLHFDEVKEGDKDAQL